jgi:hypothetical protein
MRFVRNTILAAWLLAAPMSVSALEVPIRPGEASPAEEEAAAAEIRAGVEALRAAMLRPGPHVEGWDVGGADPEAGLRELGPDKYYLAISTGQGLGVSILSDRPIADFIPAGWPTVETYGSPEASVAESSIGFAHLSPRYVVVARSRGSRRKDVTCAAGMDEARLLEIPDAPTGPDDDIMPGLFRMTMLAMEGQTFCTRYDGDRKSGYGMRYFLPDGRLLPELTQAEDRVTIVPAGPIERLIRPALPRPRP